VNAEEEAEEAVENWVEAEKEDVITNTLLQSLLAQHHGIFEQIHDAEEDEAGL